MTTTGAGAFGGAGAGSGFAGAGFVGFVTTTAGAILLGFIAVLTLTGATLAGTFGLDALAFGGTLDAFAAAGFAFAAFGAGFFATGFFGAGFASARFLSLTALLGAAAFFLLGAAGFFNALAFDFATLFLRSIVICQGSQLSLKL